MSETKETESGNEGADVKSADAATEASAETQSTPPSGSDSGAPETEADDEGAGDSDDSADEAAAAPAATPKKKKKKAAEGEPEAIKDRNARVRAEAAEKRRARRDREQGGSAPRRNLDASEMMDDALARSTHAAAGFVTKHFNKVQWAILAGLAGWIAFEVYTWRHNHESEKASAELFTALSSENGKVGDAEPEQDGPKDTRTSYATNEERLKAAKTAYAKAAAETGPVNPIVAELGAAGIAYDQGQYKDAKAAYEKVKQMKGYSSDSDIKGRTLEGLGMTLEALKDDDGALKAFKELSTSDSANLAALGSYHQARLLKAQGKNDDALKLLEKAGQKLETLKDSPASIRYLGSVILELLQSIDPEKARALTDKLMSPEEQLKKLTANIPGAQNLTPEQQKRLQELFAKQKAPGGAPAPAPAPMPGPVQPGPVEDAPAPEAPQDAPAPAPSGVQ